MLMVRHDDDDDDDCIKEKKDNSLYVNLCQVNGFI